MVAVDGLDDLFLVLLCLWMRMLRKRSELSMSHRSNHAQQLKTQRRNTDITNTRENVRRLLINPNPDHHQIPPVAGAYLS
jgi:hypothetical protein